ncbi:terminase small subunit [Clostridia bacterium]|nr:terminase small subunit [Clostridia bacterium]
MAGYDAKYAGTNADKLLKNTNISAYLDAQRSQIQSDKIASVKEVLEDLTATMRGEKKEEIPILNGRGKQKLVNKKVGVKEQLKAAELLGKRYGIFTENVNLEGHFPIVISGAGDLED